jgi:2-methylcitrate dehydratase PrpD
MSGRLPAAAALARAAEATRFESSPAAVRRRVVFLVSDVLATMVSACRRDEIVRARASLSVGGGPSTVAGSHHSADPATAALLNGLSVAAEQLQDGHRHGRGHPASHVVPAVLAVAESNGATGESMLSAVLAGYEVGVRIGIAMGGTPDGVHDIATWGTVGAAAGVAHLLADGSAGTVAAAIELAASAPLLPDAATVFGGATGQHAFLGMGAHLGVVWGSLAAGGLRAPAGTLERHFGRWAGRSFDPSLVAEAVAPEGGWSDHAVLGGYVKRHPTCAHLHGVNDAVEDILDRWEGVREGIESVLVETYAGAAAFDDPEPPNDLAARFSIPYTVAVALVTGHLDNTSFQSPWFEDGRVRSLARRVEVRHRRELDARYPGGRPALVTVRLRKGEPMRAEAFVPRGDGVDALDDADVIDKPRRLLVSRVPERRADELLAAVRDLADTGVAPLTVALRQLFDEGREGKPAADSE